jgi:hypothetical protein
MSRLSLLAAAILLPVAAPAGAQGEGSDPFVVVLADSDATSAASREAWWLRPMLIHPTGTIVSGISLDRLNRALGRRTTPWCRASAFTPRSFTSTSQRVQTEIDEALSDGGGATLFRSRGAFTGDALQEAVVGNYETCGGEHGAFLLITSTTEPRQIVYLHAFDDWEGLIWMSRTEGGLAVHSCFECGHAEELVYDRARRQFHWQNIGD